MDFRRDQKTWKRDDEDPKAHSSLNRLPVVENDQWEEEKFEQTKDENRPRFSDLALSFDNSPESDQQKNDKKLFFEPKSSQKSKEWQSSEGFSEQSSGSNPLQSRENRTFGRRRTFLQSVSPTRKRVKPSKLALFSLNQQKR